MGATGRNESFPGARWCYNRTRVWFTRSTAGRGRRRCPFAMTTRISPFGGDPRRGSAKPLARSSGARLKPRRANDFGYLEVDPTRRDRQEAGHAYRTKLPVVTLREGAPKWSPDRTGSCSDQGKSVPPSRRGWRCLDQAIRHQPWRNTEGSAGSVGQSPAGDDTHGMSMGIGCNALGVPG